MRQLYTGRSQPVLWFLTKGQNNPCFLREGRCYSARGLSSIQSVKPIIFRCRESFSQSRDRIAVHNLLFHTVCQQLQHKDPLQHLHILETKTRIKHAPELRYGIMVFPVARIRFISLLWQSHFNDADAFSLFSLSGLLYLSLSTHTLAHSAYMHGPKICTVSICELNSQL